MKHMHTSNIIESNAKIDLQAAKMHDLHQHTNQLHDEDNTYTQLKPAIPSKFKIFDDQPTMSQPFSLRKRCSANPKPEQYQLLQQCIQKNDLKKNGKVEEIMKGPPLRQKYSHLLPQQHKLPIGFSHQCLLKKMQIIDRTLEFLSSNRTIKSVFFQDLRKNIEASINVAIKIHHLQQILFLDDKYYKIVWDKNQKIKRFDILISLPNSYSKDQRLINLRKYIIKFLICEEAKFIIQNNLTKVDMNQWHSKFLFDRIQIPEKLLPPNPQNSGAQIRSLNNTEINKIKNPVLQSLFQKKKQEADVKSISSDDVANMIFSKIPGKEISGKLLSAIREKQKNIQQKPKIKQDNQIDHKLIQQICQQIQMAYMSKGVTNMFKVSLLEILVKKFNFNGELMQDYLNKILQVNEICYLKEIQASNKTKIIQIDKSKFKSIRDHFEKMIK